MAKMVVCVECGELKEHVAKGMCRKCYRKRYNQSEGGKISRQKYGRSEKGRVSNRKYRRSEKGKASN